ncbi:MAG: AsmA family protein [Propionivibrio sp.]|mgnify:CR=1 FL=1|uniref:AsmA family protein n=1 Tax=Propionivibrio sp. TaxID=2212460 RepID=UPI001A57D52A|nr:AsmA family protein [Propionivibrio sp.]MBL8413099.1 AsmA family protein [Propionivibrio sp.]
MTVFRSLKWIAAVVLAALVLAAVVIGTVGWNWLRGPIERMVLDKTGRELVIGGDLELRFGWPHPRLHASSVTFANPGWAREKQMVTADAVDITIDLAQLLQLKIVFPEVRLARGTIFLEQGSEARKNWLLDVNQQDEAARILISRLAIDHGTLGYDDAGQKTRIRAELSTLDSSTGPQPDADGLSFTAHGQYKGMPLKAHGKGGPILALRDESTPYPLQIELAVGRTFVKANGTITSLVKFTAMDMHLALRGDSLAQLFPLLGIAFPETRAYVTEGQIVHGGTTWRYEKFSGRIGGSDIAGTFQVDSGGKRTAIEADLVSRQLDLADLGPLIGSRPGSLEAAREAAPEPSSNVTPTPATARVLPSKPFKTGQWDSIDAEVTLKAGSIRADDLPLEDLVTHLSLRDSVLTLDPLDFGVAGGHLSGVISLDGRKDSIQAQAKIKARKILIAKLFPKVELSKTSIGQINGEFDLTGNGNSVGRMLATSNGKVGLVIKRGEISQLMMEKAGLHLWEILGLKMTGDRLVKVRCGVADFDVRDGKMIADALIFDTEVTTLIGSGSIDLGQETLDLKLLQKTKNTSPLALRSPIYIRGSFARPDIGIDKGPVAARVFGAIALAMVNPLLVLIPLIDPGPGEDSDCRQLIRDAQALPRQQQKQRSGVIPAR